MDAPDTPDEPQAGPGIRLEGGNSLAGASLIDGAVAKEATDATPAIHAFLEHLRAEGVDVPRPKSIAAGEHRLEFVGGTMADTVTLEAHTLGLVGALVRRLHDAASTWSIPDGVQWQSAIPAPGATLMCHNDLAPWNLVLGDRMVFIDWDAAAPSTRVWDLAYAAQAFTLNNPARPPSEAAADLRAFVTGYGDDAALVEALLTTLPSRVDAMVSLLRDGHAHGIEPWAQMHVEGHGAHWSACADYVRSHASVWAEALIPA